MSLSIVIPCYTERRFAQLIRAVDSVRRQRPAPYEIIIVVDHNPTFFGRIQRELPGVTVLENRFRQGVSGNRNTGAIHVTTPLVVFLDDDVVAHPGWLAGLVEPFADTAVVGTGGGIIPDWETSRPAWFPDEFLWAVGGSPPERSASPRQVRNVWSASMAVRRDAFLAVGGFRTDFGKVGDRARPEDTEFCLRVVRQTGGHWVYVPGAVVTHGVPASSTRFGFFLERCFAEGRGKVSMARLLDGGRVRPGRDSTAHSLDAERGYLLRTLPRAVVRGIAKSLLGQGFTPILRAGAVLLGVSAAAVGALAELAGPARPGQDVAVAPPERIGAGR